MATCINVKIDSNTSGLRFAEEECPKQLPPSTGGTAATVELTFVDNPVEGDTIQIGPEEYTFTDTPVLDTDIEIGADATETRASFVMVVDAESELVTSATQGGSVVVLTAQVAGVAGNMISVAASGSNTTFATSTLTGGVEGDGPVWEPLEPNSYADFGGQLTLVARNPINEGRQRKKGAPVGIEAAGGFNTDFTQTNLQKVMQGFMFADTRTKVNYDTVAAVGDLAIVVTNNAFPQLTSTALDFTTLGLIPGEWIYVGGDEAGESFAEDENNGFKRIRSITANAITFDKSVAPMVSELGAGLTVKLYFGDVLKNENTRSLIKRRTYQIERTLGSLDGMDPPQSEYLTGAVPNELSINLAIEDKVTADLGFVAMDSEQRTQGEGLKPGARPPQIEADMFNTSSDIARIKLSRVVGDDAAPYPMFTFIQEGTISINNGITPNKAIGVFGAIDASAGNFAVSGSVTAYFSDVDSVKAVRENADITMDMIMVKNGAGVVFDMPMIALGDGRPNVVIDEPITLPLTMEAATAAKLGPDFDYTAMWVFFNDLPERATTII
ncbi:MAG: phage tail tube protein [Acholeplasmataceae bacterium]|nr:phage tail tube protein [Acholeplasmataceae bacterium]